MIYLTKQHAIDGFNTRMAEFKPEDRSKFRQKFIIYDYEVFPDDILLTTYDMQTHEHNFLWGNNAIQNWLHAEFLNSPDVVLVGFNSKSYDNRIQDAVLAGITSRTMKVISDTLVGDGDVGPWRSGNRYKPSWTQRTFDIGFDIGQKTIGEPPNNRRIPEVSLKKWQRLNGYEVRRCGVGFDTRNLTRAQKEEVNDYGLYDTISTAMVLMSNGAWNPCLNARRTLIDEYGHMGVDWEMTKPMIAARVLNAQKGNYEVPDDWDSALYVSPSTLRIHKNINILNLYRTLPYKELRRMSGKKGGDGVFNGVLFGVPHRYGIGGLHGCGEGKWYVCGDGVYGVDVASMHPSLMVIYDYLSRQVVGEDRKKFAELKHLRNNVYKPAGDRRAEGLKLVLNSAFGYMGFEASDMYDPANMHNVTITSQLFITDLMEKLDRHVELIQSNTDGIFFRIKDHSPESLERCKRIVHAFERRTKLDMEWTEFEKIYQCDISNYVAKTKSGKTVTKGGRFGTKHCTVEPYLIENRVYSALHEGEQLPTKDMDIMRFAVEVKRDKNSECFVINGKKDDREWLDVVPVAPFSPKAQEIYVLTNSGQRRKATNCPDISALVENVTVDDVDMSVFHAPFEVDVVVGNKVSDIFTKFGKAREENVILEL